MTPRISVIITCYNFEQVIQRTIESAMNQSFLDTELIIIDDASKDRSAEIITEIAKHDSRIVPIIHTENRGISYVLSEGLQRARGTYVAILDGDDLWTSTQKLEQQYAFLESHPDHVLVGTAVEHVDTSGVVQYRSSQESTDTEIRNALLKRNCMGHAALLFRKDAAEKVGGYPNRILNQDYELCLRLGTVGKIANLPNFYMQHTLTGKNTMFKKHVTISAGRLQLVWAYRKHYPGWIPGMISTLADFIKHYVPKKVKRMIVRNRKHR